MYLPPPPTQETDRLPGPQNGVFIEHTAAGDDPEPAPRGLGDEHADQWVAVMQREIFLIFRQSAASKLILEHVAFPQLAREDDVPIVLDLKVKALGRPLQGTSKLTAE